MKKYNKATILQYITGNDIDGYDIDELEADPKFMAEVIQASKDKNTYNICSDKIKTDFNFVKVVLETFKEDVNFCMEVANKFLDSSEVDEERFVINILMRDITKSCSRDKKLAYYVESNVHFFMNDLDVKLSLMGEIPQEELGLGFIYFKNKYPNNYVILDYAAATYFEEILEKVDLEMTIHKTFSDKQKFEEYGKYKFISNVIRNYDNALADYIVVNKDEMKIINNLLNKIDSRWNYFEEKCKQLEKQKEKNKYQLLIRSVIDYIIENSCRFDTNEGLYYVAREFGVEDKIKEYDVSNMPTDILMPNSPIYDEAMTPFDEFDRIIERKALDKDSDNFDYYKDFCGLSDTNISIDDLEDIKNIRKIFSTYLGIKLKTSKNRVSNNNKKVIKFKKR